MHRGCLHGEHADASPIQAHHLLAKEPADVKVLPVAVIDIAGEEDEVDTLGNRPVDQTFEGGAGCGAQSCDGCAVVAVEAAQALLRWRSEAWRKRIRVQPKFFI